MDILELIDPQLLKCVIGCIITLYGFSKMTKNFQNFNKYERYNSQYIMTDKYFLKDVSKYMSNPKLSEFRIIPNLFPYYTEKTFESILKKYQSFEKATRHLNSQIEEPYFTRVKNFQGSTNIGNTKVPIELICSDQDRIEVSSFYLEEQVKNKFKLPDKRSTITVSGHAKWNDQFKRLDFRVDTIARSIEGLRNMKLAPFLPNISRGVIFGFTFGFGSAMMANNNVILALWKSTIKQVDELYGQYVDKSKLK